MDDIKQVLENYAVEGLELSRVKAFIEAGHNPNAVWPESGETLLHYAADDANIEVIDYLIQSGANINVKSLRGLTPLHIAVDSDCDAAVQSQEKLTMSTVRHLIELGADERIKESRGETARDIAAAYGVLEVYDAVSKLDHRGEMTIEQLCKKVAQQIEAAGFFVQIKPPGTVHFSKEKLPNKNSTYLWMGGYYHLRNSPELNAIVARILDTK